MLTRPGRAAPAVRLRGWTSTPTSAAPAAVGPARGAARAGAGSPGPRPTSCSTSTSGSRRTCRWSARPAPTRAWSPTCPRCCPGPAVASAGARTSTWADLLRLLHPHLPGGALPHPAGGGSTTALASVPWPPSCAGGRCGTPRCWTSRMTPAEIQALRRHRLRALLLASSRTASSRTLVWVNNAWVAALCIALGVLGLPGALPARSNVVNVGRRRPP